MLRVSIKDVDFTKIVYYKENIFGDWVPEKLDTEKLLPNINTQYTIQYYYLFLTW